MQDTESVSSPECSPCHHKCSISGMITFFQELTLIILHIRKRLVFRSWHLTLKLASEGTYWSTAVATVAQQIQINTSTDRTSVVVKIHPGIQGFLSKKFV